MTVMFTVGYLRCTVRSINAARGYIHATLFAGQGSGNAILTNTTLEDGADATSLAPYNTGIINTNITQLLDALSVEQLVASDPPGVGGAPQPNSGTPCVGINTNVPPGADNINTTTAGGQHHPGPVRKHVSVATSMPAILSTQLGTYAAAGGPSLSRHSVAATGHSQGLMAAMLASAAGQSSVALQLLTG